MYWHQNLANAFIVNYLWVPALLAVAAIVLAIRNPAAAAIVPSGNPSDPRRARCRRAIALLAGLGLIYAWTTLTFPTFTEPRYATPLTLVTLLIALVGLPLWPARARPLVIGVLIVVFAAGSWSPTDPVSRRLYGIASVGGEQIYDTAELQRGPDRMVVNYAILRASHRMNARLRRIFASGATLVTGDCNAMKFGEKLFSVGFQASAFDRGIPGARPLRCVPVDQLPLRRRRRAGPDRARAHARGGRAEPAAGGDRKVRRRHPLKTPPGRCADIRCDGQTPFARMTSRRMLHVPCRSG